MNRKEIFPHYWICCNCAKERGGTWPPGHIATLAYIKCEYCDGKNHTANEAIAPWVDFDWADDESTFIAKINRD